MNNLATPGFTGDVDSWTQWFGFWADDAFRAILLDIAEVFNVHLSNIDPHTWLARLLTVFFRFLITAGLVNFLWLVYRRRFYEETVYGTVKKFFWKCQNLLDRDTLRIKRAGKVSFFENAERSVSMVDFIEALDMRDFRDQQRGRN